MDVYAILNNLHAEKQRIERVIVRLEVRLQASPVRNPHNRGRKNMPPEERVEVSRRMKAYWAARRRGSEFDQVVAG